MADSAHREIRDEALSYLRTGISVSLRGLPGSGRSTILRATVESLRAAGWTVVEVRGSAPLKDRPLEALAVADLLTPPGTRQRTPLAAAVAAIRQRIEGTRALIAVDDSEMLDTASIGALSTAIAETGAPLLSSASTARTAPELALPALVRPGVRLVVPPIAFEDSHEIIQAACGGGAVATDTVARIHARAGGLPDLVVALAHSALRQGQLTEKAGVWTAGSQLWSPPLARTVEPFLQGLGTAALDGLIKLSLVGAIDASVARRLVGWESLEELDERGLLTFVTTPGSIVVSVYPPLLAEHLRRERVGARRLRLLDEIDLTLTDRLPSDSRHAQLLPALRPGPTPISLAADRRTFTARTTVEPGDDVENRDATDAVLNRLVHERIAAESLARRAEWEQRPDAQSALAYALPLMVRGADVDQIEHVLRTPVPESDLKGRALLIIWRALLRAYGTGDLTGAFALLDEAEPQLGSWAELIRVNREHLTLMLDRAPAVLSPLPSASVDAIIDETSRLLRAEQLVSMGRPAAALVELDQLEASDRTITETAGPFRALALLARGDLAGAEAFARRRYEDGVARLDPMQMTAHGYVLATVYMLRGDDAALRELIGPLLSIGYTPLRALPFQLGTLVGAARFAARGGYAATARSLAEQAESLGLATGPYPMMVAAQATAHALLAAGADPAEVADRLWEGARDAWDRGFVLTAVVAGVRALEVRADTARAATVVTWSAGAEPDGLAAVCAEYAQALVGDDPNAKLATAARMLERGFTGFSLLLQVPAAQALAATDPERGAAEARRIRLLADRLGGDYPLYVTGLTPGTVLTGREREVAELAGGGLSNADIAARLTVSVRTVENHLYRVFQKLDVDSRGELRAALDT